VKRRIGGCHVIRTKIVSTVWRRLWERFNRSCKKKNLEVVTGRARLSTTVDLHISEFMDSRSGLTYSKSMIINFGSHLEILSRCSLISDPCLSSSKTFCIGSLRLQSQELKMGFPHRLFLPAIAESVGDT